MIATDEPGERLHGEPVETEPKHRIVVGVLLTAGMAVALGAAFLGIPRAQAPLSEVARYALQVSLPSWHLTEPVNEVVYGTRGFDTFGETFLLLAAVISVVVVARPKEPRTGYFGEDIAGKREQSEIDPGGQPDGGEREARQAESAETDEESQSSDSSENAAESHQSDTRESASESEAESEEDSDSDDEDADSQQQQQQQSAGGRPKTPDNELVGGRGPERAEAMSIIVRGAVRTATPILAVTGCYLVAWGYSPGGGFPGGAVMLGVLLLVYAGFGRKRVARVIRPQVMETIEMAGATLIILTELLGLFIKGSFSANWLPLTAPGTIRSGGVAQLFSGGELVEVGTGLIIAVFALLAMSHDWARDDSGDEDDDGGDGDGEDSGDGGDQHDDERQAATGRGGGNQ